jgi:hypothetical protein
MTQVGTNQSTTYHNQPSLSTAGGQTGRSSSTSRQQQQPSQYDNEQLANIRPRLCTLRKWPHYDGKKKEFAGMKNSICFLFKVTVFI